MTLSQIAGLGRKLVVFLGLFADCFGRREPRELLRVYVQGQLSDVHRKTAEGIALEFGKAPRTLQRFLESIKWDEEKFHDRCQQIVATRSRPPRGDRRGGRVRGRQERPRHGGRRAAMERQPGQGGQLRGGSAFELCGTGLPMSVGQRPVPAGRLGERPAAPKKNYVPDEVQFRTKPQIALELIDRALGNGVRVAAWTFDELYGRDGKFLDGLEQAAADVRGRDPQGLPRLGAAAPDPAFWAEKERKSGVAAKSIRGWRVAVLPAKSTICRRILPLFREQSWQRYRIKDTDKGPEVWEVKWAVFWRKGEDGLPGRRHCLIVARNVLTQEVKYFRCQPRAGRKGDHFAVVAAGGLRSLVGGALLSRGQRRTGDGPLSGPRVALPAPAFLLDAGELLVLCADTAAVRHVRAASSRIA